LRQHLSHGCDPPGSEDQKGVYQISGGLPDMSPLPDVLSGGRHHHSAGEVHPGRGFMGVMMSTIIKSSFFRQSALAFAGLPLLIWTMSNLWERSILKESLSVVTILAFFQMMDLFFWSRANTNAVKNLKMGRVNKFHKITGYTCVTIMLLHPVLLVVPRFFESGVAPGDAFITIVTTFNRGIVLGIIAWSLLLTIGITSLIRNRLPMKYTTWRTFHGILAVVFISAAAWHAIDLGRHSNLAMSILVVMLAAGGVRFFLKNSISKKPRNPDDFVKSRYRGIAIQ
jgi:predicted ferric reductase